MKPCYSHIPGIASVLRTIKYVYHQTQFIQLVISGLTTALASLSILPLHPVTLIFSYQYMIKTLENVRLC